MAKDLEFRHGDSVLVNFLVLFILVLLFCQHRLKSSGKKPQGKCRLCHIVRRAWLWSIFLIDG